MAVENAKNKMQGKKEVKQSYFYPQYGVAASSADEAKKIYEQKNKKDK